MPHTSTEVPPRSRSQSASTTPPVVRPSNPEYAAACSPLRKIASNGCGSRLGWNASPSVPTRQCTGQDSAKSGSRAQWSPGSTWWSLVATTCAYSGASRPRPLHRCSSSEMSCAACAPPVTGSEPPSQKSFCTSTTISARFMLARLAARRRPGDPPRSAAHVHGRDDRVALRQRAGRHGQLGAGEEVPLAHGLQRLPPDDLAALHQRHQQRAVVAVVLRRGADPDHLGLGDALLVT